MRLDFYAGHCQLKWSHCSATANYLSAFYGEVLAAGRTRAQLKEITHCIAYLANELMENAVKFRADGDVAIEAGLEGRCFLLRIENWIAPTTSAAFQKLLGEITAGEPGDLLIQRIEANAEGGYGSGLGLLTLMSDYGVRLSWRFGEKGDRVLLETVARLNVPAASASTAAPI